MRTPVANDARWLDCANPADLERYERAFYQAFERASHNLLVRWLWDWDHEARRLRTRVPYDHQRIWATFAPQGDLVAAIGVNVRLEQLQAAAFGFAVPADLASVAAAGRLCEFLTLFIVAEDTLADKSALWRGVFDELRGLGFTHAVATTALRVLPLYRWIGGTIVGSAEIEGEKRFFLRFDLTRTTRENRK